VSGGTAPGLTSACLPSGTSDATLTTGITLATSFVGKVVTPGDTANQSDTNGVATFPQTPATFDWSSFDNSYRAWGKDGIAFPDTSNRGQWTTGAGRIWDWSLKLADTVVRNVLALKSTGSGVTNIITHTWSNTTTVTYLRDASEIMGDGIGNDNGLCESNETCIWTPNIGSYQGHGTLVSAGTFTDGTITGVTLMKYSINGH